MRRAAGIDFPGTDADTYAYLGDVRHAADDLVDSYHDERHPWAEDVAEHTLAQTALITATTPTGQALRRLLSDLIGTQPDLSLTLARRLAGLDVHYGKPGALAGSRVAESLMIRSPWSTMSAMSESVAGSRADVDSLMPWARRLYADGASSGDVMVAVYGVDLPAEAYAFHRDIPDGRALPVELLDHPWDLLSLADPARPAGKPHRWSREQEAYAYSQHPDVLPLMQLGAGATTDGVLDDHIIGYDLAALRAGGTAIVGHEGELRSTGAARFEPLGDSLVDVLLEWMSEHLAMVTSQYESPTNFGFGSLELADVAKVAEMVGLIEGLRTG